MGLKVYQGAFKPADVFSRMSECNSPREIETGIDLMIRLNKRLEASVRGDCWVKPVEFLVFPSPTGYMLTSFGFPLLKSGYILKNPLKWSVIFLQS